MRKLTVSQKYILKQQAALGKWSWDELSAEVIERIEAINDSEILYQEANRYLSDIHFKVVFLQGGENE